MRFIFQIWFFLLPFYCAAQAPQTLYEASTRASEIAQKVHAQNSFPGLAVAVAIDGHLVWAEGFGHADVDQKVAIDPFASQFRIGSISKSLTAVALAQLAERRVIDLDKEVQLYVSSFPKKEHPLTVRQVAGHISGIRHYQGMEFLSNQKYESVDASLEIFKDDPLLFAPGTRYSYSSYGWNLISAVIEGAGRQPFLDYMQAHVFDAAGMRNTMADYADRDIPHRVQFYVLEDEKPILAPPVDNSYKWAGGGFLSTATDLISFANAVLDNTLMNTQSKNESWKSCRLNDGSETNFGLGWRIAEDKKGRPWRGHGGGSVGGTSMLLIYPDHNLAVVTLVNLSNARMDQLAWKVAEQYLTVLEK